MDKIYMNKDSIPEDCNHCNFKVDGNCVASKEYDFDGYTVLCCPRSGKCVACPIKCVNEVRKETAKEILQELCDRDWEGIYSDVDGRYGYVAEDVCITLKELENKYSV